MNIGSENLFYFAGFMLFAAWLLRTSLGRRALDQAPIRRTNLHPLAVLMALIVWQAPPVLMLSLVKPFIQGRPEWVLLLVQQIVMTMGALLAILFFCGLQHSR